MSKKKILSDIFAELLDSTIFLIKYSTATDNLDGTYTLSGICDIRYIQPGFTITIDGNDFIVKDYEKEDGDWNIILEAGSNALPAQDNVFQLYPVYFFHGTPMQTEMELSKIAQLSFKTPMIYLMEPYQIEEDNSFMSSIDRRANITLCFLTQADIPRWLTANFYHNAINPMYNLSQDFMQLLVQSNLFYTAKQKGSIKFYTKFGINIQALGTKNLYFSENLSGVGLDIRVEVYSEEACCTTVISDKVYTFINNEFVTSSKLVKPMHATTPDNGEDLVLIGAVDGDGTGAGNRTFQLPCSSLKADTLEVHVDGSYQRGLSIDYTNRTFILTFAPTVGSVVSASWQGIP